MNITHNSPLLFFLTQLRSEEYDVTLLEAGPSVGGLVAGWKTQGEGRQGEEAAAEGGDGAMSRSGHDDGQDERSITLFHPKDGRINRVCGKEDHRN